MTPDPTSHVAENPFSAKFIRPGAIEYAFAEGTSAESLVALFLKNKCRGEIVSPHGTGKSTLLATLAPTFAAEGIEVVQFTLRDGQRKLPSTLRETIADSSRTHQHPLVIIIDGYEQLSGWSRWWLGRFCDRRDVGLLITAHISQGFPPLEIQQPTETLVLRLARQRLAGYEQTISNQEILLAWTNCQGDLRETFFTLYDTYERQRRC